MNYKLFILSMAALTLAWGCSSDDEETAVQPDNGPETTTVFTASAQPQWQVDMNAGQPKPQWTAPDPSEYENSMVVMVRLQDELVPFSTDDDLMAVFVDDDCRALSTRDGNSEKVYFVLNVHGNSSGTPENYQVCYYSGGLKQLFVLNAPTNSFLNERILGVESDFSPAFTDGSTKYAVKTGITVSLPDPMPFEMTSADRVAVFVGNECCGVGIPGESFTVYGNSPDEEGQLRYYSHKQGGIYTSAQKIKLTGEIQNVIFEF